MSHRPKSDSFTIRLHSIIILINGKNTENVNEEAMEQSIDQIVDKYGDVETLTLHSDSIQL